MFNIQSYTYIYTLHYRTKNTFNTITLLFLHYITLYKVVQGHLVTVEHCPANGLLGVDPDFLLL